MLLYGLTIFIGAFLLFQVQPLIAKYILPWFGGGPGVWTTCLLFFQSLLVAGYAYAHFSTRRLKPRTQAAVHAALVALALALLPIIPGEGWKPGGPDNPVPRILALLAASVGLPYFVLSATGPLLQEWFARARPGKSPYRLYALSNAGSLLALLSYPVYFETHFTRKIQANLWGWGLAAYAVCAGWCALRQWRIGAGPAIAAAPAESREAIAPPAPGAWRTALWVLWPACASVLLLATTNKLCRDMVVMPFLWVLPLALYLLSFIICFDNPRWYARSVFAVALVGALGGFCWLIFRAERWPMPWVVAGYCGALFICCLVCHGELYRLRPAPARLTQFYLAIAVGGAAGGFFVAVVAPLIFTGYFELHTGILLCAALYLLTCVIDRDETERHWRRLALVLPVAIVIGFDRVLAGVGASEPGLRFYASVLRAAAWTLLALAAWTGWIYRQQLARARPWRGLTCATLAFGIVALGISLWATGERLVPALIEASRTFYGRLRIVESESKKAPAGKFRVLLHERIMHGWQFTDPPQSTWPTLYYGEEAGAGLALKALPAGRRRIGLIGMGAGTLAAYAQPGDCLRIYEINPEVVRLAKSRFSYLSTCRGTVEVALGDARLSLEREPPQNFNLLVLDAFSGDNIPVHLLTAEAFELYQRHLATNGVIAAHISNVYLDLEPVFAGLARHFGYRMAVIDCNATPEQWWIRPSRWVLLTRDEAFAATEVFRRGEAAARNERDTPLWTDDFASLFQIFRAQRALEPGSAAAGSGE